MNHKNSKKGGRPPPAGILGNELKLQQEEIFSPTTALNSGRKKLLSDNGSKLQQEEIVSPTMALNSGRKKMQPNNGFKLRQEEIAARQWF